MTFYLKNIINSERGKIVFSIILGLGLASLFRQSCKSNNCLIFKVPKLDKIKDKVFNHNNKCYTFSSSSINCNETNNNLLDIENDRNAEY